MHHLKEFNDYTGSSHRHNRSKSDCRDCAATITHIGVASMEDWMHRSGTDEPMDWPPMCCALRCAVLALIATAVQGNALARQVRFHTWDSYIAPELTETFEHETGIRVVLADPFTRNDHLYDVLAQHPGRYDLITPLDHQIGRLIQDGHLEKYDPWLLPGFYNVEQVFRSPPFDRGNEYSVPFLWGTSSFVVDTAVFPGDIDHLSILFDPPPPLQGRVGVIQGSRALVQSVLMWLGYPECSADPAHLQRVHDTLMPLLAPERISTINTIIDNLVSGSVAASFCWNGDALRARLQRPTLKYAYPKEGVFAWSDYLAIPIGAPNRDEAIAFVSFLLEPRNIAMQSNFTRYANSIRGSARWLDPMLLEAPEVVIPPHAVIRLYVACDAATMDRYDRFSGDLISEVLRNAGDD